MRQLNMAEVPSMKDVQNFQLPSEHTAPAIPQPLPVTTMPQQTNQRVIMDFNSVDEYTTEGLRRIIEATKAFQALPPAGAIWDLQKSYPEFSRAMKNCRTRILPTIKSLLEHSKISTRDFKKRDLEEKFDFIVDSNDDILERIGSALDEASGLFKRTEILVVNQNKPGATRPISPNTANSWGKRKAIDYHDASAAADVDASTKRRKGFENAVDNESKHSIGNKKNEISHENRPIKKALHRLRVTEKPQIHFKVPVDNSLKPFIPKLKEKPNSLKPLSILPEYNSKDEEFYGHPYNLELNRWEPDEKFMTTVVPQLPLPLYQTPVQLIRSLEELENMMKDLRTADLLGIDLEHHAFRTFLGLTCTIQISTRANDYVIDALALREELECLNEVFTKPKVIKILHGAQSDIEWLQRDFGVYIVGLFDTFLAAKTLGLSGLSLQYLLQTYCKVNVDKTYQLADWRIRPLPADMIEYSRQDTHYLPYLYDLLKNELIKNGNQFKNLLTSVYDQSRNLCLKRYEKPSNNPQLALRKTRRQLNSRQLFAFTELHKWRDAFAREKDESLAFILPNHMLLMIAESLPKEMTGILACCDPVPPMVQHNLGELHRIILQARDLPLHEEKVQMGVTEKHKKVKNWIVMLNSIHDVTISELIDNDEGEESKQSIDKLSESIHTDDKSWHRRSKKKSWSEPFDPDSIDISGIKIKTRPSSNIFARRHDHVSCDNKPTASSAYERYQLSNEIVVMLKDPKKKEQLDLEDPLVRVVYETLLGDAEESAKIYEKTAEERKERKKVGKLLPDSEFVPFNPMAQELNTFRPPAKKKTKKGKNTYEEWNDGEQYEDSSSIPKDFIGRPLAEETPVNMEEGNNDVVEDGDKNEDLLHEQLAELPASKSKKKKRRAKFLEQLKLKKLMKLKRKKTYELEQLEREERSQQSKDMGRLSGHKEIDIIEIDDSPSPPPKSRSKHSQNHHGKNAFPVVPKKQKKKTRGQVQFDDEDVVCLD